MDVQDPASSLKGQDASGCRYLLCTCNGISDVVSHYNVSRLGHRWPDLSDPAVSASLLIIDYLKPSIKRKE